MIAHTGMKQAAYVAHLEQVIKDEHLSASGNPEDWANESHKASGNAWVEQNGPVDEAYFNKQIKVVDDRLALAGLRLAALLDDTFKNKGPQDFKK
jgi:hypothetical protein